jgi:hypothetical protein
MPMANIEANIPVRFPRSGHSAGLSPTANIRNRKYMPTKRPE